MSRILLGIICGLVFGAIDIGIMLSMSFPVIFQPEVVEQRFGTVALPHHDRQSSENQNQTEHGQDHFLLTRFG